MRVRLFNIPILIVAILSGIGSTIARARSGVVADGWLTVTSFGGLGEPVAMWSSTNQFRISLDADNRYALQVRPIHETGDAIYQTFDGTDTFFVRYREAVVDVNQNIIEKKPLEKNVHPAYISSGNYPFVPWEEQKRPHILWLVYGSGTYLHDVQTNTMPLPWIAARWSMLSFGFRVEYELFAEAPYLPKELRFIRDYKHDMRNDELEMERPELNPATSDMWIAKWRKELGEKKDYWVTGFVAGRLESKDFATQNGVTLPMSFSFKAYHPRWRGKSNGVRWQYDGLITNKYDLPMNESFQPPIDFIVGVDDSRFRFNDSKRTLIGINYPLTKTNKWPSRNSPELIRQQQAYLESPSVLSRVAYGRARNMRIMTTAIITLILLLVPWLLFRWAKTRQNQL